MHLLPPGPYLPHGDPPSGDIDLGCRLRDDFFHRRAVQRSREALGHLLPVLLHHGEYDAASRVCQAWLETWPAAALIDGACEAWRGGPDPRARAVLERVTELHALAHGWEILPSGLSLLPDAAWLRGQLQSRTEITVISRGEGDGSEDVAERLGLTVGLVDFSFPDLPERTFGWAEVLRPAAAHALGRTVVRSCQVATLPGTPDRIALGDTTEVGWLLWDAPHPPRPVHPGVIDLIETLESPHTVEELTLATGWTPAALEQALASLAAAGAVRGVA